MASGFGLKGNTGRCYPLWTDFRKCMADADATSACAALREDYVECLHHRKEYDRINSINRERKRVVEGDLSRRKAEFEHKWFGKPLPADLAGHH